jgi:hemolysin D
VSVLRESTCSILPASRCCAAPSSISPRRRISRSPRARPRSGSPRPAARLAQAAEQQAKLASVAQQIDQKRAEPQSVTSAIAKINATLPLLEETLIVSKKAMEIQYGNRIALLDTQTRLVDQQNERILQARKQVEAARRALDLKLAQTKSGFERQVLSDLADAQKKGRRVPAGSH